MTHFGQAPPKESTLLGQQFANHLANEINTNLYYVKVLMFVTLNLPKVRIVTLALLSLGFAGFKIDH